MMVTLAFNELINLSFVLDFVNSIHFIYIYDLIFHIRHLCGSPFVSHLLLSLQRILLWQLLKLLSRSSHAEMFCKKVLLKTLQSSEKKTSARVSFLMITPPACNFIKKETPKQMFSCRFCRVFKNTFRQRIPPAAAFSY